MKNIFLALLVLFISSAAVQSQPATSEEPAFGSDRKQTTPPDVEYQHQYYVYNESGRKTKLFIKVNHEGADKGIPFDEKEVTVSRNDTVYLGNFTSPLENVRPRSVFEIFVRKRSWIFFTKTYEAFVNVNRQKIGTDAVNYYLKIMGTKRKAEKKKRFEE